MLQVISWLIDAMRWRAIFAATTVALIACGCAKQPIVSAQVDPPAAAANPVPAISSLAPNSATAGSADATLTVKGSNFISASELHWNGAALATTYVSATQLTATVPAANLNTAGSAQVTAFNPTPGGGASSAAVFDISSTNPTPSISLLSPASALAGSGAFTLTVDGSGFLASTTVNWNGLALTTTYVSATQVTATVPASDVNSVGAATVTAVNPAPGGGTSSAAVFDVTSTNPMPSISSLSPASVTAGSAAFTLTVNGSNFVGTSTIGWNGTALATTHLSSTQLTAQVPAGDLGTVGSASVTVVNPSPGGGTSAAASFTITATNPVPSITSLSPASVTAGSGAFTLTVNGSNFVGTSTIDWNGTALATTHLSTTQLSAPVPASDVSATGFASVTVVNPAPGGGASAAASFTVSATNPVPAISSLSPASVTAGNAAFALTVNGSNFVVASVVKWNGTALPTTHVSATQLSAQVPASDVSTAGSASVTVVNPAPGGGTSAAASFTINASNPLPAISSLSPTSVTAGGNAFTLTVNGSNLVASSAVHWNGNALPTTYVGATQLTAQVPASAVAAAGTASITVVNPAPGGGTSGASTFTVNAGNPVPAIATLSPSSASAGGAAFALTVNGSSLVATSTVHWNGTALPTTYVSGSQITAQVPAGDITAAGTANVTVVNPAPGGGTSAAASFTINATNPLPSIASLSPSSATAGGAAFTLTVNGSNFIVSSAVKWNGNALPTTYVSASQLTAQVSAGDITAAGTFSVTVVNPTPGGGTSGASTFTVNAGNPVPSISSLSPNTVTAGGAAFTLTVNGASFVGSSAVHWNGTALPTTYVSAAKITAQVPASDIASAGSANITVVNPAPGGGSSSAATLTINPVSTSGPSLVQWNAYQTMGTNAFETNSTLQFTSKTTAHNAIWVAVTVPFYMGVLHTISVSDSQGNTFTKLDQKDDPAPGSQSVAHFYAANIVGDSSTPDTITVNWTYDNYKAILVTEISGVTTAPMVDHAGNIQDGLSGGTDNITGGSLAVSGAQTPALLIALTMDTNGGISDTGGTGFGAPPAGTGFTQVAQVWALGATLPPIAPPLATLETKTLSSSGSYSATFDANVGTSDPYVTVEAIFH